MIEEKILQEYQDEHEFLSDLSDYEYSVVLEMLRRASVIGELIGYEEAMIEFCNQGVI